MNVWGQKVDDDKVTKKQMSITLFPRNELNVDGFLWIVNPYEFFQQTYTISHLQLL